MFVIPGCDVGTCLDLCRHRHAAALGEVLRCNGIEEPDVYSGDVPGQFHGRLGGGVWFVIVILIGDRGDHFTCCRNFADEAFEEYATEGSDKFWSHS